jgi:hypothetical protein
MQLQFEFNNGTPAVNFTTNLKQSTPLELVVLDSTTNTTLLLYMQALSYLLRGVTNYASGNIVKVGIEGADFGQVTKSRDSIIWKSVVDRTYVVIYEISLGEVTEHVYVADGIVAPGGIITASPDGKHTGGTPLWAEKLFSPSNKVKKDNIISAIAIATEFLNEYKLIWDDTEIGSLVVKTRNGNVIELDSIPSDEVYSLIQLLYLVVSKSLHTGVLIINAKGFSDKVLNAFVSVLEAYFKEGFLFLGNLPSNSKLERVRVELPDFTTFKA